MGICASADTKPKGRNTRKGNTKRGDRARKNRRNRKEESSEESSRGSTDDDEDERPSLDPVAATAAQQVKINTQQPPQENPHPPISVRDQEVLFYKAGVCNSFSPNPVSHEMLRNAMKLALLAPSAYNCCPMRVVFVHNEKGKAKLANCVETQEEKQRVMDAPVCAIIATDLNYTSMLPRLMPYVPNAQQMFEQYDDLNEMIRIRNSNLQAGYLILALRSLGLAVGPISDMDTDAANEAFLQETSWKSSLYIPLGFPRDDRSYEKVAHTLTFDAAAKLLV